MRSQWIKSVLNLDMYGHDVEVLYKGKSSYKTYLGTALSLFVYILVITDLASLSIAFIEGTK